MNKETSFYMLFRDSEMAQVRDVIQRKRTKTCSIFGQLDDEVVVLYQGKPNNPYDFHRLMLKEHRANRCGTWGGLSVYRVR